MDLLVDILGQLDGPTLASVSRTCPDLRDAAQDRELWRQACHSLWPSTSIPGTNSLIPDFKRFYEESYPLVLYEKNGSQNTETTTAPGNIIPELGAREFQDFTSLVDVYYQRRCIFSQASIPIPEVLTISHEEKDVSAADVPIGVCSTWLSNSPFHWGILELPQSNSRINSNASFGADRRNQRTTELEEHLRLSWVLLDKRRGKCVNLSSWAPISSQSSWNYDTGKYRVHFGCILPVGRSLFPHGMVKCKISVGCRLTDGVGPLELEEIGLHMEDLTGKHLDGKKSLIVLKQALLCSRSTDKIRVKEGFSHYEMKKRELKRKNEIKERVAIGFFTFIQVTVFLALLCVFTSRFT